MQKQNKIISIGAIQGKLPRLAFVNILGVATEQNRTLERLPHYLIQLAEKKTAQKVDVYLRFEENTLNENDYDHGLVREQLKNWLSALLDNLDDHYALAFYDGAPWAPPRGHFRNPQGFGQYGNPQPYMPAGAPSWGMPPQQQPEATGPEPTRDELALEYAAQNLLNHLRDRYHQGYRPTGVRRTSLQAFMNYDNEDNLRLSFNMHLANGLTSSAYQIVDRAEFDAMVEKYRKGEEGISQPGATFKHQGHEYHLTFTHNLLADRLMDFVTEDALKTAWNQAWNDYWQALTGANVVANKDIAFIARDAE